MAYDFEKTSVPLYRAIFKSNYASDVTCYLTPDADLAEAERIAPILHPSFEAVGSATAASRPPDIVSNRVTGMYDPDTGGTSVFDRPNVLKRADGDFLIPDGTDIPPDLKVKKDSFNQRLQATHYTIMPAKPLFKQVLMAQLDNLVRNAIRRRWEQARGL